VGVPGYRISEMVKNGGDVLDAYGFVNVIAPCGIPMRGIVGIHPDPIMLVAFNCENVQKSKEFYQQLGFVEQVGVVNMCTLKSEYRKLTLGFLKQKLKRNTPMLDFLRGRHHLSQRNQRALPIWLPPSTAWVFCFFLCQKRKR
jgi:hypothetical protein